MLALPFPPPKDYELKDINPVFLSAPEFTPSQEPRVTLTSIGKNCVPVSYEDNEEANLSIVERKKPHAKILEKYMRNQKALWLMRPGKDDFLIHDVFKKYTVNQRNYDPRFMNKEKIFNRAYQYEQSCLDEMWKKKLKKKIDRDNKEFDYEYQILMKYKNADRSGEIPIRRCKEDPPFWWQTPPRPKPKKKIFELDTSTDEPPRYFEEPNLTAIVKDDPCQRKKDMLEVGGSFKHNACLWYYEKYPPWNFKLAR